MPIDRHILVGRDVYSRDDMKVGEIDELTADAQYVVVERPHSGDLLIPMDQLHEVGGRLEVRCTRSYLDDAPYVDPEDLTLEDRRSLEAFYRARAA